MSREPEDRLRDLLQTRARDVSPASDWEDRVLVAGKRRRRNRRVGVGVVAAAVVALAVVGANTLLSPVALEEPGVVQTPTTVTTTAPANRKPPESPLPSQSRAPAAWKQLTMGRQTTIPYAADRWLSVDSRLATLREPVVAIAGSSTGVVVVTLDDTKTENNNTVHYFDNGAFPNVAGGNPTLEGDVIGGGTDIDSLAISADGRRAAWTSEPTQGNNEPVFQVVDLSTRDLVATVPLPDSPEYVSKIWFLGDAVLASGDAWVYRWDGGDTAEPWRLGGRHVRLFHGASERAGIALVFETNCMKALSLADGSERWKRCPGVPWRISPDGRFLAEDEDNTVVIRSAETGAEIARHRFPGTSISAVEWETPTSVVAVLESDEPRATVLVRCPAGAGACEAVPSQVADKEKIQILLARRPGA